jgi:hypothetical protein
MRAHDDQIGVLHVDLGQDPFYRRGVWRRDLGLQALLGQAAGYTLQVSLSFVDSPDLCSGPPGAPGISRDEKILFLELSTL